MVTMIVDTLPVFYYEKLVGYMPSCFADLVFARERIDVGLKRGKFDYVSPVGTNGRRTETAGAKPPQTPHGTHQNAQHHPSF